MNEEKKSNESELPAIPEATGALAGMATGGKIHGLVPQSFDQMRILSVYISKSGLAPKGMERPETIFTAMQMGMEIGLMPMQAIQNIAVINGRPAIWGDAMLAVVRGSGELVSIEEKLTGQGDSMLASCTVVRKGDIIPVTREFSVQDAKDAGLWGKSGPWQQYKKRMLQMRARSWALRDVFPDILRGMFSREEILDLEETVTGTYETKSAAKDITAVIKKVGVQEVDTTTGEVTQEPPSYKDYREQLDALKGDREGLKAYWHNIKDEAENTLVKRSFTMLRQHALTLYGPNLENENVKPETEITTTAPEPAAELSEKEKQKIDSMVVGVKKYTDVQAIHEYMRDNRQYIVEALGEGALLDRFDDEVTQYVDSLLPEHGPSKK